MEEIILAIIDGSVISVWIGFVAQWIMVSPGA